MDGRQGTEVDEQLDDPALDGLDLVERTEELIRATESHAAELAERSAAAVAHLQEEMRLAERVLEAAETRRRVAEAEVKELSAKLEESERNFQERMDVLTSELTDSLEQTERSYQARIDALTAELTNNLEQSERTYDERIRDLTEELEVTQQRAARAEDRAQKAEHALARVQQTLKSILQIRSPVPPDLERSAADRLRKPADRR
jgi:chromosome segregation ATPase